MPLHNVVLGAATGGAAGGGILSSLLGGSAAGGGIVSTALGLATAPLAIAGSVLADPVGAVLGIAGAPVQALAGLGLGDLAGAARQNGVVDTTGFAGGNGRTATRTIVQTMDLATGQIIRTKTMPGSPRLMNSDVAAARKVIKSVGKLHNQMPRRTVKEGEVTKLKNAAVQAATARVTQIACDPKC